MLGSTGIASAIPNISAQELFAMRYMPLKDIAMNRIKYMSLILLILVAFICRSQNVDGLLESDKVDLISYILKSEKVTCVYDNFLSIGLSDSTLFYLANTPELVQKSNCEHGPIDFKILFSKKDVQTFKQQLKLTNSKKRLSQLLVMKKIKFLKNSDSTFNCNISFNISYPLLNTRKNAMVVSIEYYGNSLMSGAYCKYPIFPTGQI